MSPTETRWNPDNPAAARRWQPLSMVGVFAAPNYEGFVLTCLWIGFVALSVWWPLADNGLVPAGSGFTWNRLVLDYGGTPLVLHFYLPWVVSVLLVMWFGLEWAAPVAYLATLFATNMKGMPVDLAVVNALHNPLAIAVYFLFYSNYPGDYTLRGWRSWAWFILASFCAAMVSSSGAFISEFTGTELVGGDTLLQAWLGWVPNAFLLSLLCAPLLLLFSPAIERYKARYFRRGLGHRTTQSELVQAAGMFALMLVLFLVVEDHWMARRVDELLKRPMPETLRIAVQNQFSAERFVIGLFALLLAAVSLGGVFFTSRWMQRLRKRFDTEARQTRDALRRSETNFRNFFENNPAPMLLYDRDTTEFVDVNQAAVDRYGYSRGEFLELTIFDIRPPEDVPKLKAYMREMGRSNQSYRHAGEWRHRTKAGEIMHVDVRVSAIVIDNRAMNLVLVYDVSPRKQAQEAVERRARELQQLAASSLEIAGTQTVEQLLRVAAVRARELSGARIAIARLAPALVQASLAEEHAAWLAPGQVPDTEAVWQVLVRKRYPQRLTAAEVKAHPDYPRFLAAHGRAGSVGALLAVPLTRSDSELMGALIVADKAGGDFDAEDESILLQLGQLTSAAIESVSLKEALQAHMQELEERVQERTAELDASNKELDSFAYSVAHDLRAPLRAMHGFADAILEDYGEKLDDPGRDYLSRIIKGAKNMDTLIQDLLSYSRVGREKIELEPVPLSELVSEVLMDLHHTVQESDGKVEVSVPPLTVLAHKATLKQVLLNLVSNAFKFVAPGTRPEVRIWAAAREGMVDICVKDNGIGIAPEHHERIFNVFERLHGAEAYPGTGIGLSIVKKGLARMHGEIRIESGGGGSTFHARLKEYRNG